MLKKTIKIVLLSILGLFLVLFIAGSIFIYKAKYGINFYETSVPILPEDLNDQAILLFSKTNGFRHGEAIEASIPAFKEMAKENGWTIYETDKGGVFNSEQLKKFKVVIWNNTSGKVLNDDQRSIFKEYIENGGGFVGIHASGDDSHQWDWYEDTIIGARFSHHPISPQFQEAKLNLEEGDSTMINGLYDEWTREDEWYMFFDNPREKGSKILYTLDETGINPSGNIKFLASDKDWGMGDDHPVVWYHEVGKGRAFYSALGHKGSSFQEPNHLTMLENAIEWAGYFSR